jgi:DNA-binding NarL/FixJ family response regulator
MSSPRTRIFIVDDHPLVRDWLSTLLGEQKDFEVCGTAEEPSGALEAMKASPPDIAIVDLSLKNGSGLDLIKDMQSFVPSTRVIVLSMHEEVFYAERALRAGAKGYVTKRESTAQIAGAIREVRAGRIYASAEILNRLTERMLSRGGDAPKTPGESLSDRELDVYRMLGAGKGTREISEELKISIKTVQAYCARIKDKLQLESGTELVRHAIRWVEKREQV